MSEQFRVDCTLGDGAAVDSYVLAVFPRREVVYHLREDLLAGTALAGDKHREVGWRHLHGDVECPIEAFEVTDNAGNVVLCSADPS